MVGIRTQRKLAEKVLEIIRHQDYKTWVFWRFLSIGSSASFAKSCAVKAATAALPPPLCQANDMALKEIRGRKIPESPWGSSIPVGDGDGDVNRFPDGDGDGDEDEAEKRGWGFVQPLKPCGGKPTRLEYLGYFVSYVVESAMLYACTGPFHHTMCHAKALCGHMRCHRLQQRRENSQDIQDVLASSRKVQEAVEMAKKNKPPDLHKKQ
ncbi:hypothetical protein Tco_0790757 [Tanacetum coccineum]